LVTHFPLGKEFLRRPLQRTPIPCIFIYTVFLAIARFPLTVADMLPDVVTLPRSLAPPSEALTAGALLVFSAVSSLCVPQRLIALPPKKVLGNSPVFFFLLKSVSLYGSSVSTYPLYLHPIFVTPQTRFFLKPSSPPHVFKRRVSFGSVYLICAGSSVGRRPIGVTAHVSVMAMNPPMP